jgi:hypothetical protein
LTPEQLAILIPCLFKQEANLYDRYFPLSEWLAPAFRHRYLDGGEKTMSFQSAYPAGLRVRSAVRSGDCKDNCNELLTTCINSMAPNESAVDWFLKCGLQNQACAKACEGQVSVHNVQDHLANS